MLGCNIGEASGAAIGYLLGRDMFSTILLAAGLAFAIGYLFTIVPMPRTIPIKQAASVTVVGDTQALQQWKL